MRRKELLYLVSIVCLISQLLIVSDCKAQSASAKISKKLVIVKLKDSVTGALEDLVVSGARLQEFSSDNSPSLDSIFKRYGLVEARPIFRVPYGLQSSVALAGAAPQVRDLDRIRAEVILNYQDALLVSAAPRIQSLQSEPNVLLHHVYSVEFKTDRSTQEIIQTLIKDPHVEWAQAEQQISLMDRQDYCYDAKGAANDYFACSSGTWGQADRDLWGVPFVNAPAAWEMSQGEGIVVGVVDSGVDYNHPDLAENIWINPCEDLNHNGVVDAQDFDGKDTACPGHAVGNGLIDDIRGYDFAAPGDVLGNPGGDNNPMDFVGHGTHVAGIIAARADNSLGILGVAPKAKIMIVKGFSDSGGANTSRLLEAMYYAGRNGAQVINASWGCTVACPREPATEEVVRYLMDDLGVTVVFAAGNTAQTILLRAPQNMMRPKPIVVGAIDPTGRPATFSNFGSELDLMAPGAGIVESGVLEPIRGILSLRAALVLKSFAKDNLLTVEQHYLRQAGTSMSAPFVSGAAAILLSRDPTLTPEAIRHILRAGARKLNSAVHDYRNGAGVLDIERAIDLLDSRSTPEVGIIAPLHNIAPEVSTVKIEGYVDSDDLKSYSVYWKKVGASDSTRVLISRSSTSLGSVHAPMVLATWDTSQLAFGQYELQLVAITKNGRVASDSRLLTRERLEETIDNTATWKLQPDARGDYLTYTTWRYTVDSPEVVLRNLVSGRVEKITNHGKGCYWPKVSSDGAVVWIDKRDGAPFLYLKEANQPERKLFELSSINSAAAISTTNILYLKSDQIRLYSRSDGSDQLIKQFKSGERGTNLRLANGLAFWEYIGGDFRAVTMADGTKISVTDNLGSLYDIGNGSLHENLYLRRNDASTNDSATVAFGGGAVLYVDLSSGQRKSRAYDLVKGEVVSAELESSFAVEAVAAAEDGGQVIVGSAKSPSRTNVFYRQSSAQNFTQINFVNFGILVPVISERVAAWIQHPLLKITNNLNIWQRDLLKSSNAFALQPVPHQRVLNSESVGFQVFSEKSDKISSCRVEGLPEGATFDEAICQLYWAEAIVGEYRVSITAENELGVQAVTIAYISVIDRLHFKLSNPNHFSLKPGESFSQRFALDRGASSGFAYSISRVCEDSLGYACSSDLGSLGISVDRESGEVKWVPGWDVFGQLKARLWAVDLLTKEEASWEITFDILRDESELPLAEVYETPGSYLAVNTGSAFVIRAIGSVGKQLEFSAKAADIDFKYAKWVVGNSYYFSAEFVPSKVIDSLNFEFTVTQSDGKFKKLSSSLQIISGSATPPERFLWGVPDQVEIRAGSVLEFSPRRFLFTDELARYTISPRQNQAYFSPYTGNYSYRIPTSWRGKKIFKYTVTTAADGRTATQEVQVNVIAPETNRPPQFELPPVSLPTEDFYPNLYFLPGLARTDADGESISYTFEPALPPGFLFSEFANRIDILENAVLGSYPVTITATDARGASHKQSTILKLERNPCRIKGLSFPFTVTKRDSVNGIYEVEGNVEPEFLGECDRESIDVSINLQMQSTNTKAELLTKSHFKVVAGTVYPVKLRFTSPTLPVVVQVDFQNSALQWPKVPNQSNNTFILSVDSELPGPAPKKIELQTEPSIWSGLGGTSISIEPGSDQSCGWLGTRFAISVNGVSAWNSVMNSTLSEGKYEVILWNIPKAEEYKIQAQQYNCAGVLSEPSEVFTLKAPLKEESINVKLLPFPKRLYSIPVGREFRLPIITDIPLASDQRIFMSDAPVGSRRDSQSGEFVWTPTVEDLGRLSMLIGLDSGIQSISEVAPVREGVNRLDLNVVPLAIPSSPQPISLQSIGSTSRKLVWFLDSFQAETISIEGAEVAQGPYSRVLDLAGAPTQVELSSHLVNESKCYRLIAQNSLGKSKPSNPICFGGAAGVFPKPSPIYAK